MLDAHENLEYYNPKAKLVIIPKASEELEEFDLTEVTDLVAFCARVSNPSNQLNSETSDRLIKYLLKHKHFSPFEMVSITVGIDTTRDIARQILRHRSFAFQEFSQRYANPEEMGQMFVLREARLQDAKNRQNSISIENTLLQEQWALKQLDVIQASSNAYQWAIEQGIAKEQARCVLPEGNTVSRLYMAGTIRSWIHWMDVRSGEETQKEHRQVAHVVAQAISKIFPMIEDFKKG